ncbi:MAG: response regulator transcription factor [Cryomorphaceae bacterium]
MKISVNLVDDHQIVTDGLASILSNHSDITVQDVAQSGTMALAQLAHRKPDIVLLDYSLEQGGDKSFNGLKVAETILERHPEVKIMMLTMHDKSEVIVPCVSAGVHGYMLKSEKNADFGAAIRHLYRQGHYFSPEVAKDLATKMRKHNENAIELSDREQEVLKALYKGSSTREIAKELYISHHTVESHRKSIIQKFNAKNSVHLIYLALKKGFLSI